MTADAIVDALFRDLDGRRGFHVRDLPPEVRAEMRGAFLAIIQAGMSPPGDPPWVIVTENTGMGMRRPPGLRIVATEEAARQEVARVARSKGWVLLRQDVSDDVDGRGYRFGFGESSLGPVLAEVLIAQRAVRS